MLAQSIQAIILAAGKSTRMNSGKSKLLEKICGQEIILYLTNLMHELNIPTTLVIGHQSDEIKQLVSGKQLEINYAYQHEQNGTGHALFSSRNYWNKEQLLVLNGDMPLISKQLIQELIEKHQQNKAALSFVTAHNDDPTLPGYGRIIKEGNTIKIVEAREFTGNAHDACCVNAGIYLINRSWLENPLLKLPLHSDKQEYYITDLVKLANDQGLKIETVSAPFDQVRGINTFKELWTAEQIKRSELISCWMNKGIHFAAAQTVQLDVNITIESGSSIGAGVHLLNGTTIGKNCTIEPFSIIDNSTLANNVTIKSHSIIKDSVIGEHAQVGPFAHVRNHTELAAESIIGNFVEVKQSSVGKNSKIKHLSYIGDTTIGKKVNIGAGTITCNYNGVEKQKTIIEDEVFIGSNNTLVAPITLGKNAYTAAGSVITESVPADALAIGRTRQINKEHYAAKLKEQNSSINNQEEEQQLFFGAHKSLNDALNNQ